MSSPPFLGIDFGTCNSSMAWFNPRTGQAEVLLNAEGEDKTPSVVWFGPQQVLVGKHAEERLEIREERRRVIMAAKRELARPRVWMVEGRAVTPVDVAAEVFRKLKRDAETLHFYKPVSRAVLTHPAIFDEVEKDKLREAARRVGFEEVELMAEPVAAALAYAVAGVEVGRHVLVYDLGGGTFDLALLVRDEEDGIFRLAMEPCGARLGGDDFDRAIYDYLDAETQKKFGKPLCADGRDLHLMRQCRKYKENLSSIDKPVPFSWWLAGLGRLKLKINRTVFEGLIVKPVIQTVKLTRTLREDALAAGHGADSVILIGGSTRIPLIQRRLQEALQVEPRRWQKQDLAVTLGAAQRAQTLWGNGEPCKSAGRRPASGVKKELLLPAAEFPVEQPVAILIEAGRKEPSAWYMLHDGLTQRGPFSLADLQHQPMDPLTLVWKPGLQRWVHADQLEELKPLLVVQACRSADWADQQAKRKPANADGPRCPRCRWQLQCGMAFCPRCGFCIVPRVAIRQSQSRGSSSAGATISAAKTAPRPVVPRVAVRPEWLTTVVAPILMLLGPILVVVGIAMVADSSDRTSYRAPNPYGEEYRHEYRTDESQRALGMFVCFVGGVATLTAVTLFLLWLYEAWSVVPPESGGPSPGLAVGLLFIPLFSWYWMFRVIPGLSTALRRTLRELDPSRHHGTAGYEVGVLACTLCLVPCINVISFFLLVAWMYLANDAKDEIIAVRNGRPC